MKAVSMSELRFAIYGNRLAVARRGDRWCAFWLGPDGKRRPAEFVIPDFVDENEMCQYLADLFHESATSSNGDVLRIL